jgi:hypothetical protein
LHAHCEGRSPGLCCFAHIVNDAAPRRTDICLCGQDNGSPSPPCRPRGRAPTSLRRFQGMELWRTTCAPATCGANATINTRRAPPINLFPAAPARATRFGPPVATAISPHGGLYAMPIGGMETSASFELGPRLDPTRLPLAVLQAHPLDTLFLPRR